MERAELWGNPDLIRELLQAEWLHHVAGRGAPYVFLLTLATGVAFSHEPVKKLGEQCARR